MSLAKRLRAAIVFLAMSALCCACLVGCGEPVAATYDGGKVTEDEVTQTIENMRVYYELDDDAAWAEFVKNREYETDANQTAVEKAASQAPGAQDGVEERPDGTVEEMREYVIEQIIRSALIDKEIKSRNIQVDEASVDAYVEQQRSYVESRLMAGVFESVLQRQGYKDLEEYREEIRNQLRQVQLQSDVSTVTDEYGIEISGKAAWNEWFDELYASIHAKINPAPDSLSYAIVENGGFSASDETE